MSPYRTKLYLRDDFQEAWKEEDPFRAVLRLRGKIYRELDGRRTLRFERNGRGFFLKLHTGVGWLEILKNLVQLKSPILSAENEWRAIEALRTIGVDTMSLAGYGVRGANPASRISFVITEELEGMQSLEDLCAGWRETPPEFCLKKILIDRVALMSRLLHGHGLNHRDYYICHFLTDAATHPVNPEAIRVVLIDLHRVQQRRKTPERWIFKDLGSLCFSAMDIGLKKTDLFRFMKIYSGKSLRQTMAEDARFWSGVRSRAVELYKKVHGTEPPLLR